MMVTEASASAHLGWRAVLVRGGRGGKSRRQSLVLCSWLCEVKIRRMETALRAQNPAFYQCLATERKLVCRWRRERERGGLPVCLTMMMVTVILLLHESWRRLEMRSGLRTKRREKERESNLHRSKLYTDIYMYIYVRVL